MEITESKIHYVIYEDASYTRHSADNWTIAIGESDEQVYECSDIEAAFQSALAEKPTSELNTKALRLQNISPSTLLDTHVILCKPNYLAKDGSIKKAIVSDYKGRGTTWLAPKDDLY